MNNFYDTSALLENVNLLNNGNNYISSITLKELEEIKNSRNKDEKIKYRSRKLLHVINEKLNQENSNLNVVIYDNNWNVYLNEFTCLTDNNDSKIIISALNVKEDIIFYSNDLNCRCLAIACGLKASEIKMEEDNYCGYKEIKFNSDEELADFYSNTNNYIDNLLENEYLLILDKEKNIIDKYKRKDNSLIPVKYSNIKTKQFGNIKPKDAYQELAIDALSNHKTVALRGPAGSGKSYLAMSYLFQQVEKGKLDRIVIFCNTVAVDGAAKLGFYPGDKNEKLLDSQIGNFLTSKIGDKMAVEDMINHGEIILLPMADIRGYDTTGMRAGVYIQEAQNLDIELMRLCIQRTSDDSILILDGDDKAQVDMQIYSGENNGLKRVSKVFRGDSEYAEVTLKNIYRSHRANLAQLL